MIDLALKALAYIGVAASIASISGYYGFRSGANAMIAEQAKEDRIAFTVREDAMRGAAEAIAANRPIHRTIINKVQHELQTNTIYRDCRHNDEQLRNINAAIEGKRASQPAGDNKLPKANRPG